MCSFAGVIAGVQAGAQIASGFAQNRAADQAAQQALKEGIYAQQAATDAGFFLYATCEGANTGPVVRCDEIPSVFSSKNFPSVRASRTLETLPSSSCPRMFAEVGLRIDKVLGPDREVWNVASA